MRGIRRGERTEGRDRFRRRRRGMVRLGRRGGGWEVLRGAEERRRR